MDALIRVRKWLRPLGGSVLLVTVILPLVAQADLGDSVTYPFRNISNNSSVNVAQYFSLTVEDLGSSGTANRAQFTFRNLSTATSTDEATYSSITDIYFYDGTLFGMPADPLTSGGNHAFGEPYPTFELGAQPDELGQLPDAPSQLFSVGSDNPSTAKGIEPGEWLGILFDLQSEKTFTDVINAINLGLDWVGKPQDLPIGSLVIGLRVQGIADAGANDSDQFVVTPVPATILLGMLGLGYAGMKLRKLA